MRRGFPIRTIALMTLFALAGAAFAAEFIVDWFTVDGGGETFSIGGGYRLGGTIGQPDAGVEPLTGGNYKLTGGFWTPVVGGPTPVKPDSVEPGDEPAEPTEPQPVP